MFDIGWTELLVIGVVALIVVGPKDLPGMFRTLGRFTAKVKGMAREFHRAMDQAADEAGAKDIAKDLKTMSSAKSMGLDKIKEAATEFGTWEPDQPASRAMGSETAKLTQQRAEAARKSHGAAARKAQDRLDRKAAQTATASEKPATERTGAISPTRKTPATKKKTSPARKAPTATAAKPAAKSSVKRATSKPKTPRASETKP